MTIRRKLDQLLRGTYGQKVGCQGLAADPSSAGIAKAVDERTLEFRRFQTHKEELAHEFYSEGFARVIPLARQYHERRVAFFVINGWTDAIQICIHNGFGGRRALTISCTVQIESFKRARRNRLCDRSL